jgi:hypothetical protein
MFRRFGIVSWGISSLILALAGLSVPVPASAQGFESPVLSRARVFPDFSSGVVAMKRDSAGHYYLLATPPNVIWIASADGKRIGQIPRAGSDVAKIQYAVDFDLSPDGRVLVADRAANAIEVFSPEGVQLAKIPIFAPTGVVALPDDQFAVSTLRSKRLVEIRSEQGALIRSFGDPTDAGIDPDSKQLQNPGKSPATAPVTSISHSPLFPIPPFAGTIAMAMSRAKPPSPQSCMIHRPRRRPMTASSLD